MAPEVATFSTGYDAKADIWSLGISAMDLAQGEPPRFEVPPSKVIWLIPHLPPPTLKSPQDFSPSLNHFIAYCLVKEPADRPSAEQALKHPFVEDAIPAPEAMKDLLKEVHATLKQCGGLERTLKQAKQRIKQEKKVKRLLLDKQEDDSNDHSRPSSVNITIEQPQTYTHIRATESDKPQKSKKSKKTDRKKKILKTKLVHFFNRRPKQEEMILRGFLEQDEMVIDFSAPAAARNSRSRSSNPPVLAQSIPNGLTLTFNREKSDTFERSGSSSLSSYSPTTTVPDPFKDKAKEEKEKEKEMEEEEDDDDDDDDDDRDTKEEKNRKSKDKKAKKEKKEKPDKLEKKKHKEEKAKEKEEKHREEKEKHKEEKEKHKEEKERHKEEKERHKEEKERHKEEKEKRKEEKKHKEKKDDDDERDDKKSSKGGLASLLRGVRKRRDTAE